MSVTDVLRTVLVHRRGTFFLVFLVFVTVAAGVVSILPPRYEASAALIVGQDRPISASGSAQRDDVLAKSYAELLRAPEVADRAAEALGGGLTRTELASSMSFIVTPGTQLLAVTATDGDRNRAAQLANVYAETFVSQRQAADAELRKSRLDRLDADIRTLSRTVQRLRAQGASSADAELSDASARLSSLRATYQALDESLVLEGSNVSLAARAAAPTAPSAPRPRLYLFAASILGLFLGAGVALLRDRLDRRVWSEEEVLLVAPVPIVGRIPKLRRGNDLPYLEAFDFLRTNLVARSNPRTILITSPGGGNGKTTIASGLARSLADVGHTVVAADCDFRNPTLSRAHRGSATAGLRSLSAGHADARDTFVTVEPSNLWIAVAEDDVELTRLDQRAAEHLVDSLAAEAEYVVIDTAPITSAFETSVLAASKVDAVILVVDLHDVRREALVAALGQLAHSGVQPVGIVINRAKAISAYNHSHVSDDRRGRRRTRELTATR